MSGAILIVVPQTGVMLISDIDWMAENLPFGLYYARISCTNQESFVCLHVIQF